ncbi:hypothetical protein N9562_00275 [Flavobacteriaceae bacterium]|nr:hypothetical protein [Flavobacteriaceae bacterium]
MENVTKKKDRRLSVWLTHEDWGYLETRAKEEMLTISTFVKRAIYNKN